MTKTNFNHSGIEWLGQIPKHWEIVPLKAVFQSRNEDNRNLKYTQILSLLKDIGVIPYEEKGAIGNKSKENLSGYKIARKNDFILNKMNAVIGSLGVSNYDGLVSPIYLILYITNSNYFLSFYSYIFQSKEFQKSLKQYAYGIMDIRESIDFLEFKNAKLPLPPLNEQRQIAEFLDKKCEKISEFIAKKQRLITLLKEQKQTLINECVCGRLDFVIESERSEVSPSLRASKNERGNLKHSGVEWLGQIPKHWEVRKLKTFAKVVLGKMLCSESKQGYTHEHYLKSKNIQWLSVDTTSIEKMYFSNSEKKLYKIQKNDLLVSEGGEVGKTCIWQNELTECYLQNSVHKVTFNNNYNPRYFLYLFFAYGQVGEFDSSVSRVSIAHLTWDILINIKFIVPPLNEQRQIAEFLDKKCEKIDKAIRLVEQEINKMKEYKTSLIDKAVKGQINA